MMNKKTLIKKINEVENGKVDTRSLILNLLYDLNECVVVDEINIIKNPEIETYADYGQDGILVNVEPNIELSIDWDIKENEKGDSLYSYIIT